MARFEGVGSEMQCRDSGLYDSSYNRDCHPRGSVFLNVHGILMPGLLTLDISRSLVRMLSSILQHNPPPPLLLQPQLGCRKVIIVSIPIR